MQPFEGDIGVHIRRKDRVADVGDPVGVHHQRDPAVQDELPNAERGQAEGRGEFEARIAEQRKRHMLPLSELALLGTGLSAETEHFNTKPPERRVVIAIAARLRCTTPSAGDAIPSRRLFHTRNARPRVHEDDRSAGCQRRQVEPGPRCRLETQMRKRRPDEVLAGTVVDRCGETSREFVRIVRHSEQSRPTHHAAPNDLKRPTRNEQILSARASVLRRSQSVRSRRSACAGDVVELTFHNGSVRVIDLEDLLSGPAFAPIRDGYDTVRAVAVNTRSGTLEFSNGSHISLATLYLRSKPAAPT